MKKFYELTKEDLKKEEREFKKTAYGNLLFSLKVYLNVAEFIFVLVMIIPQLELGVDLTKALFTNATLWVGILLSGGFDALVQMKFSEALKEYIVNK